MQLKGIALVPTEEVSERTLRDIILQIASLKPETLVLVEPDGFFLDAISVDYTTEYDFGEDKIPADMACLDELNRIFPRENVPSVFINPKRAEEFGVTLGFSPYVERFLELTKRSIEEFKVASIGSADLEKGELLETGRSLREAIEVAGHPCVLVVFTALATEDSVYSEQVKNSLKFADFENILRITPPRTLARDYRTLLIALGATDKLKTFSALFGRTVSEGALLTFTVEKVLSGKTDVDFTAPSLIAFWDEQLEKNREALRAAESEAIKMVRACVELWVKEGRVLNFETYAQTGISDSELLERLLNQKTGVYVTIKKNGKERGNMGSVSPITDDIAHEMINNAIEAASYDQRFVPIVPEELDELSYEVYVLDPPEYIQDESELDYKKYGLIVEQGLKRGVVLPGIEDVASVAEQIRLAKERAGIDEVVDAWEPVIMSRFSVEKF